MKLPAVLVVCVAFAAVFDTACASSLELYASEFNAPTQFYSIDPTSGQATEIGPTRFAPGLDFRRDGTLYGSSSSLHTIDTASGAYTTVGVLDDLMVSITFSPSDELYAVNNAGTTLFKLDPATGATLTSLPLSGTWFSGEINGIDFAPDGTLFGIGARLYTIDPTTGHATRITQDLTIADHILLDLDFGADGWIRAVTYAPEDRNSKLHTIDPATGLSIASVSTGVHLTGLASVPEPSSIVLAGCGLVGLAAACRRRLRLEYVACRAAAAALLAVLLTPVARADFTLIDDFQGYAVASPIDGQGTWQAEAGANAVAAGVATDPLDAGNRVLNIGDGGFSGGRLGHRETINTAAALRVNQGETATLFFRLAWDTEQLDVSIGMSDVANPISDTIFNSFTQFESQLAFPFASGADRVRVRDGGSFDTLTTDVAPLTWYSVWMVIDNAADTTEVFLQGGAFAAQTQLDSAGQTSFGFRNGPAANDLLTLFIATGRNTDNTPPEPTENVGPLYVDDIYIDPGRNLANPVPEPSTLVLGAVGLAAFALGAKRFGRFRSRDRL